MKDVAGSGKAPYGLVCGDFAKRHSKMFSLMLVLTLIALVAFAAFLVVDILSFESNASYENVIDLANQSKNQEPTRLEGAITSNLSREDTEKRPDPTAGANSSPNNASTLTGHTNVTTVAIIMPSGSDSHKSDKKKKHSSLKNNTEVNRDDAPPSSTAAENQSQLNQSQNHANLSSHATEIPSYNSRPGDTDDTDISFSNSLAKLNVSEFEPSVQVVLPVQELSGDNSIPSDDDEDLGHDSSDEGVLDGLVDVSSELQHPEHSVIAEGELDFSEPTSKVVPADKSSFKWRGAENKRLSSREKRGKIAKIQKRQMPARPTRTRPVRPARDNSRD